MLLFQFLLLLKTHCYIIANNKIQRKCPKWCTNFGGNIQDICFLSVWMKLYLPLFKWILSPWVNFNGMVGNYRKQKVNFKKIISPLKNKSIWKFLVIVSTKIIVKSHYSVIELYCYLKFQTENICSHQADNNN